MHFFLTTSPQLRKPKPKHGSHSTAKLKPVLVSECPDSIPNRAASRLELATASDFRHRQFRPGLAFEPESRNHQLASQRDRFLVVSATKLAIEFACRS